MSLASEFKEFAMRGSVIDLAVGVVIGAAFGTIVSSLVNGIIMPLVGVLSSGNDFSNWAIRVGTDPKGAPVLVKYGLFVQAVVDFLIVALVLFIAIKGINALKKPPAPSPEQKPPRQEVLLEQIRDLLAKRSDSSPNADTTTK